MWKKIFLSITLTCLVFITAADDKLCFANGTANPDSILNPDVKVFRNVAVYEFLSSGSFSSIDLYSGQTVLANDAIRDVELADSTGFGRDRFYLRSGDGNQDNFAPGQETIFLPRYSARGPAYSQANFDSIKSIDVGHPDPILPTDFYNWSLYSAGRSFVSTDIRVYSFWLKGKKINYGLPYECYGIMFLKSIEAVIIGGIDMYKLTLDVKINIRAKNDFREYIVGVIQISSGVPSDFILYQNFPNPFNPVTKIKFELPKSSFVNLLIFNSLGEQVENYSGQLKEGVYEYDWYASQFPSGVYFYKLQTSEFTETKKMILLK